MIASSPIVQEGRSYYPACAQCSLLSEQESRTDKCRSRERGCGNRQARTRMASHNKAHCSKIMWFRNDRDTDENIQRINYLEHHCR